MIRVALFTLLTIIANLAIYLFNPWQESEAIASIPEMAVMEAPEAPKGRLVRLSDVRAAVAQTVQKQPVAAPEPAAPTEAVVDPLQDSTRAVIAEIAAATGLPSPQSPKAGGSVYVVQPGDSLTTIAQTHYGDPMEFRRIFEANRAVIGSAPVVAPGMRLVLP
ncbi:LysM peptidoglycan-binding domain-containing protein [Donghicola mangrovi]|nr:LysM peptidoglycan-binding domain-containing protein [Donghicola mangrovi]